MFQRIKKIFRRFHPEPETALTPSPPPPVPRTPAVDPRDLDRLQQIARDAVFEPFEGRRSLETIKTLMTGLEKGASQIGRGVSQIGRGARSAGGWVAGSKFGGYLKTKWRGRPGGGQFSELWRKVDEATKELQLVVKKTYRSLEEQTRSAARIYIPRALELLLLADAERYILSRARTVLQRNDLFTLEQARRLSGEERQTLIEALYPHDAPSLKKYTQAFDVTLNVGLGAVSNIPLAGAAVSVLNIAKTIVKLANRLHILSAIHGRQIASTTALYVTSNRILAALADWENNPEHRPLKPDILGELYQPLEAEQQALADLLGTALKKDAYIAVPGAGIASIGKIAIDDYKMDKVVLHLVENYFAGQELLQKYDVDTLNGILSDFERIYRELGHDDYLKRSRKMLDLKRIADSSKKWKTRLKLKMGLESTFAPASTQLDVAAKQIYLRGG